MPLPSTPAPIAPGAASRRAIVASGNALVARGALDAGCNFFAGYPITPSSEIYAELMRRLPAAGGIAVGAPDEISALNYVVGAALAGARAMTATSGPGFCLMIETVQYALMTETPAVIVVVQRLGPATGGATQGAQGDVALVAHAASGGYPVPVLAPVDAADCHALTIEAFRIAERLRTPVIVLSDKEVGMTAETVALDRLEVPDVEPRAPAAPDRRFVPYRIERDGDVPRFAPVGGRHKVTVTGSAHNQQGELRKNDPETLAQLRHLAAKVEAAWPWLERVRHVHQDGSRVLVLSYGISARTCREVRRRAAAAGPPLDFLEVLSLHPVPSRALARALAGIEEVVVVEENGPGLYAHELQPLLGGRRLTRVNQVGAMITPQAVLEAIGR